MNLPTSRAKVTEALQLLKQGNPHGADELLVPLIHEGGVVADAAAIAVNWIGLGLPGMARTELEGFLRKTALRNHLEVAK